MTDRELLKGREYTIQEFANFLNAKKVNSKCPSCNSSNSSINADEKGNVSQIRYEFAKFMDDGSVSTNDDAVLVALPTTCKNCGYIRAFFARAIERWLEEQQLEEKAKDE